MNIITPDQCRMARAALKWGVKELSSRANVGINTVTRFELAGNTTTQTIMHIRQALESAGIEFIPENGGGAGVRLKKP